MYLRQYLTILINIQSNQVSYIRMILFCYHLSFCCHFEQPSGASFKKEFIKFFPCIVQTVRDKKCDITDTAEDICSMHRDKILWENAKIVATKNQMITNKWNSDEGYHIIVTLRYSSNEVFGIFCWFASFHYQVWLAQVCPLKRFYWVTWCSNWAKLCLCV